MSRDLTSEAVERAIRFEEIKQRAQAVKPVETGRDILHQSDTFAERCVRMASAARDRLL